VGGEVGVGLMVRWKCFMDSRVVAVRRCGSRPLEALELRAGKVAGWCFMPCLCSALKAESRSLF
jgi:hypothetical protein